MSSHLDKILHAAVLQKRPAKKFAGVLAAGLIFCVQALLLVAVTTLSCVAFEYIY